MIAPLAVVGENETLGLFLLPNPQADDPVDRFDYDEAQYHRPDDHRGDTGELDSKLFTEAGFAEPHTAEHFGAEDRSQRSAHDAAGFVDRDDVERVVDFEPHAAPAGKETMCVVRASALKAAGRAALASMFNHSPKWPRCRILFYSIFIGTSPPS